MNQIKELSLEEICFDKLFPQEYLNELKTKNIRYFNVENINSIKENLSQFKFNKKVNEFSGIYLRLEGKYSFYPAEELQFEKIDDNLRFENNLSPGLLISSNNLDYINIYSHPDIDGFLYAQYLVKSILKKESFDYIPSEFNIGIYSIYLF